jgi:hypothetical protein
MFNVKENCNKLKIKFSQQYANVSEEDLVCSSGRQEEMLENIQQKIGKTREELHEIIYNL